MRTVKASKLAASLGISRRAMSDFCKRHPQVAEIKNGDYYVHLEEIAKLPGFDLVTALMLPTQKWIKAVALAQMAKKSRKTINNWCRTRPNFAIRLGRTWYVNVSELGLIGPKQDLGSHDQEEIEEENPLS